MNYESLIKDLNNSLPKSNGGDIPLNAEISYQYPVPEGVPGQALDLSESTPKIFTPLKIGSLTIPNRIGVSPMAQYSADHGSATDYHKVHYGAFAQRAPGLIVVESTSVQEFGRASAYDLGLWNDKLAESFKPLTEFVHAQAGRIGIQLNHSGRKSLAVPYYISFEKFDDNFDKSKLIGPSPIEYRKNGRIPVPKELTVPEIKDLVKSFGSAAKRAATISNFDFVEIHGAHGYIISEFLSKISNQRTDQYGGSFENRTRFLVEVVDEIKSQVPPNFPIFIRIHGSDLHEGAPNAWTDDDAAKLADLIADKVDLIDVSAGGNDANADRSSATFGPYVPIAEKVKKAVGNRTLVSTVCKLHEPEKVNRLIEDGIIDMAFVGSPFIANPGLVYEWADKLGVKTHSIRSHFVRNPPFQEMMEYVKSTFK
ncbi:probable NADPH dehydrogenase [[Candida] jaroonii]|uniref:Probable NADPH dehydrogenase n=1 Tax=[Candida] jaroonii TaxID=467808 RepID=A0ACA9Y9T5_9ASCO|nr:probable NADPH dehydrogenase [[Candida] jaroonii]